jgi:hypothetical protein
MRAIAIIIRLYHISVPLLQIEEPGLLLGSTRSLVMYPVMRFKQDLVIKNVTLLCLLCRDHPVLVVLILRVSLIHQCGLESWDRSIVK